MSLKLSVSKINNSLKRKKHNDPASIVSKDIIKLDTDLIIDHDEQARSSYSKIGLDKLMTSIESEGQLEPIHCYKKDDKYVVVSGHRRLRAFRSLNLSPIDVLLFENIREAKLGAVSINEAREDMHPLDKGREIASLLKNDIFPNLDNIIDYYKWSKSACYRWLRYAKIPSSVRITIVENDLRNRSFLESITEIVEVVLSDNKEASEDVIDKKCLEATITIINDEISRNNSPSTDSKEVVKKNNIKRNSNSKIKGICFIENGIPQIRSNVIKKLDNDEAILLKEALEKSIKEVKERIADLR